MLSAYIVEEDNRTPFGVCGIFSIMSGVKQGKKPILVCDRQLGVSITISLPSLLTISLPTLTPLGSIVSRTNFIVAITA